MFCNIAYAKYTKIIWEKERDKDMPGKKKKVILISVIVIALIAAFIVYRKLNQADNYHDKYAGYDLDSDVQGVSRDSTYAKYLQLYGEKAKPSVDVEVDLFHYTDATRISVMEGYEGEDKVLHMEDEAKVSWQVDIPESGLYNMYIEYYPIESRGVDIERAFYINGTLPFSGSDDLAFSRVWGDKNEVREEIRAMKFVRHRWSLRAGRVRTSRISWDIIRSRTSIILKPVQIPLPSRR